MLKTICALGGTLCTCMLVLTLQAKEVYTDTIQVVQIKVTVIPKTNTNTKHHNSAKVKSAKKVVSTLKRADKDKSDSTERGSRIKEISNDSTPAPLTQKKTLFEKHATPQLLAESKEKLVKEPAKRKYLVSSFLLLITGIIVVLFYRSGLPLIFAILLIVTGYYILLYSLLFMPL